MKSTIEIKTAFEGCAEVCTYCDPKYVAIKIDINPTNIYECRHINWCMRVREVINKLSEQTADNPLDDLFADSMEKLNGLGVEE